MQVAPGREGHKSGATTENTFVMNWASSSNLWMNIYGGRDNLALSEVHNHHFE